MELGGEEREGVSEKGWVWSWVEHLAAVKNRHESRAVVRLLRARLY